MRESTDSKPRMRVVRMLLTLVPALRLPIAEALQRNLIWFGILAVVAVEIGLLSPPSGISLPVTKNTLNESRVGVGNIFTGIAPFTGS